MAITSATISVRDLHIAKMNAEDTAISKPVYDAVRRMLTEAVNVTITPTAVSAQAYGDGGVAEAYEGTNGGTVSIQVHSMAVEDAVYLFGEIVDANGVKITSDNNVAPYIALGFVTDKGNGKRKWIWVYKVKMQKPNFVVDTKTNTVTFQQPTITGVYLARKDDSFKVNGRQEDMVKAEYDEDSAEYSLDVSEAWFEEVYDPAPPIFVAEIAVTGEGNVTEISTPGGTLQMTATVTPEEATRKGVTWSVINGTGTATITQGGLLAATGDGVVNVIATAQDGSGVAGQLQITISGQA